MFGTKTNCFNASNASRTTCLHALEGGEADLLATDVVDVAVGANEGITKDPGGSESGASEVEDGQVALRAALLDLKRYLLLSRVM